MKNKLGYHYTSYKNWQSIQKKGMHLYTMPNIKHKEIKHIIRGIWLWKKRLTGLSHVGTLILQASNKKTTKIVLVEVKYDSKKLYKLDGRNLKITHEGFMNDWYYHKNEESVVLSSPVAPEDMTLLKTYDIVELLK